MFICQSADFFPPYKELEGSILGFSGHTISVEVTVP